MEIKRYRCIKSCIFDACDDDGFLIENQFKQIEVGSIWQESNNMIAGGKDNIHLNREDGPSGVMEWCEPLRRTLSEYFEPIESIKI